MKGLNWMASVATVLAVSLVSPNVGQAKVTSTAALFQSAVQLGGVEAWFRIPDRGQLSALGGEATMRQALSGSAQSFNSAFSRSPGALSLSRRQRPVVIAERCLSVRERR